MLNEIWLKNSINSNDPNKFRKHFVGVLVAIRRDLDTSTKIKFKCEAEILGVTITFSNGN